MKINNPISGPYYWVIFELCSSPFQEDKRWKLFLFTEWKDKHEANLIFQQNKERYPDKTLILVRALKDDECGGFHFNCPDTKCADCDHRPHFEQKCYACDCGEAFYALYEVTNDYVGESYSRIYIWTNGGANAALRMAHKKLAEHKCSNSSELKWRRLFEQSDSEFCSGWSDTGFMDKDL